MNQIKSEFSRPSETKDNLFSITRNFGRNKDAAADVQTSQEDVFAILDSKSPNWNCEVIDMRNIGKMVLLTAAITIDGVKRHGIGTAADCTEVEILRAEQSALVCAAKKFDFVRDALAYGLSQSNRKSNNIPSNPIAQSLFDMITSKQISIIKSTATALTVDAERECQKLMHCSVGELSRKAAAYLIDYLEAIQNEQPLEVETALRRAG